MYFSFPLSSLAWLIPRSLFFFFFFFRISSDFLFFFGSSKRSVVNYGNGNERQRCQRLKTTETWKGGGLRVLVALSRRMCLSGRNDHPGPGCCYILAVFLLLASSLCIYFSLFHFLFFSPLCVHRFCPFAFVGLLDPLSSRIAIGIEWKTQSVDAIHLEWARSDV